MTSPIKDYFKIGDKVRLNSGGPIMTVIEVYLEADLDEPSATIGNCKWKQTLRCIWPAGDSIGCHEFGVAMIQRVTEL